MQTIRKAIKDLGKGGDEKVAEDLRKTTSHTDMNRSSVVRWRGGELKVWKDVVSALATFLKLKNASTPEEVEEHYGAYWSLDEQEPTKVAGNNPADDVVRYSSALERLRNHQAMSDTSVAETVLAGLFDTMGLKHFIVVTTQNMPPAGFPHRGHRTFVERCYAAMDRGLLVAYVVPDQKSLARLERHCPFMKGQLKTDHRKSFDSFRDDYASRLRALGHEDIAWDAAVERAQLFEWPHEFPLTPCFRTISLIGGQGNNDVLERGPHSNNEVVVVPRSASQPELLREFILEVLKCESPYLRDKSTKNKRGTNYFVEELQERMNGNRLRRPTLGNFPEISAGAN